MSASVIIDVNPIQGYGISAAKDGLEVVIIDPMASTTLATVDNLLIVNSAAGTTEGDAILNIAKGGFGSVLAFKTDEEIAVNWGERTDVYGSGTTITVTCKKLETILAENNLTGREIEFLNIETSGSGLDVLQSLGSAIAQVKKGSVIAAATAEKSFYKDQTNTVAAVIEWLTANGLGVLSKKDWDNYGNEVHITFCRAADLPPVKTETVVVETEVVAGETEAVSGETEETQS